jgi:putative spermidine/putrescine transport system permease protein
VTAAIVPRRLTRRASATRYGLPLLLAAPATIGIVVLVLVPLVSVARQTISTPGHSLTAHRYSTFLSDSFNLSVIRTTLVTSVLVALISLVLAYPISVYMVFARDRVRRYLMLAILSPLLISVIVRSYALVILLGPNNPFDRTLPSAFHFDILFTQWGVVVGLVYTLTAFMILSLVSTLGAVDPRVVDAARSLGAGSWSIFWRILLPLSLPGIESGCIIVFTLSATSFALPLLLGGTAYKVVVSLIYQQMLVLFDWPSGYTIAVILFVFTAGVLVLARLFFNRMPESPLQ